MTTFGELRARLMFNAERRARFYQKMAQFARDGHSITFAIRIIHERHVSLDSPLAHMTGEWMTRSTEQGTTMLIAKGWIPEAELGLIVAGESTDNIHVGFSEAERLARTAALLKQEALRALATPAFALVLLGALLIAFNVGMGPVLHELLEQSKWPWFARLLYAFSSAVKGFWWLMVLAGIALGAGIGHSLPTYRGAFRSVLDRFPPWSIYKVMVASGFLIAIAGLLKQGKPLDTAIKEFRESASPYVDAYLEKMQLLKARGVAEAKALDVGLLDDETAGDLADMGRSGRLENTMQSIGQDSLEKSVRDVQVKAAALKYLLLLIVGMCLVWMFSSFLVTSYQSTQEAKRQSQVY